jgi:hypothetical protein
MHFLQVVTSTILALSSGISAEILPEDHILWGRGGKPTSLIQKPASPTPHSHAHHARATLDGYCKNSAFTRSCWDNGFSISADFDEKWPNTGVVRKYNFVITNTTCAPDGISRQCSLVNGQYPGPTIIADWGDTIEVTVRNALQHNGTGIHWHGVRQYESTSQDGANGLTECPLAPGDTKIYKFLATQVRICCRLSMA